MALVPAKTDPRQAQETARRLRDPGSFGVTHGDGSRERKTDTQRALENGRIQLRNPHSRSQRLIVLPDEV